MSGTLSQKRPAPYQPHTDKSDEQEIDQHTADTADIDNTEDALEESEQRFRAVWDSVSDAMALSREDGTVFAANPAYYDLYGYRPEDILGHHFSRIFPEEQRNRAREQYEALFQQGEIATAFESVVERADGSRRIVEARYSFLVHRDKRTAMLSSIRDITVRKQIEEQLRQSRDQLAIIFQNVADGISVQDAQGNVIYMNDAGATLCGYSSPSEVLMPPDFQTQRTATLQRFEIRDEQGNPFPVTELPGSRVLRGESNSQAIVQYYDRVSRARRWSQVKSRPILDGEGRVQSVVTIFSDITDSYEVEQRKDEFISIASHELKTPITSLKGLTQLLRRKLEKQGATELVSIFAIMETQINRLTRMVNDLLDISKIQAGKLDYAKEAIDLDAFMHDLVENLQMTTTTHTLAIHGTSHATIEGDSDRLAQVFINLIGNAIKYSPQATRVDIALAQAQETVTVSVQDYGDGISTEHQRKIFDRFYRVNNDTDKATSGLGMGLYIAYQIVKRHHGEITIVSEEEKGTTFTVSLPRKP